MTLYKGNYCKMDTFMVYIASSCYDEDREARADHILERAIYSRLGGQLAIDQRWHDQWVDRCATHRYFEQRAKGQSPSSIVLTQILEEEAV